VLQGFESISGQINVELKVPLEEDKLFFNAYINSFGETQLNLQLTHQFGKRKKWASILSLHTAQPGSAIDKDGDGFLDLPKLRRYAVYNKWIYGKESGFGLSSKIGLRFLKENRIGGKEDFRYDEDKGTTQVYGQSLDLFQPEVYTKTGYRFNEDQKITFFGSASSQSQDSYFGEIAYDASQLSLYTNLQFEWNWHKNHMLYSGFSYRYLDRDETITFTENLLNRKFDGLYTFKERIPGIFAENTFYWNDDRLVLITGIRLDHINGFGNILTPRALIKCAIGDFSVVRGSIGKGFRSVHLFSEKVNLLASSREIIFEEEPNPEEAINMGINFSHSFFWKDLSMVIGVDFYHTRFINQVYPDYDSDPGKAIISNFRGKSISNSFQAETKFIFTEDLEFKLAYNFLDVYRFDEGSKVELPFNPTHRIVSGISYRHPEKAYQLDMNLHWYGKQRLANTKINPEAFRYPDWSDPYSVLNMQVSKTWSKLEWYLGCENVLNFRQDKPIIGWQDPFGPYFDTSNVWGPTRGREIYSGLRIRI